MASACIYIECPVTKLILGVSRKNDLNAFGLPGGKVEPGETEEAAALRELKEETGTVLYRHYKEIFRREGGVTFRAHLDNVRFVERGRGETGRVAWVTPEQLMAGPFGDYNRCLLEHIGRIPKRAPQLTAKGQRQIDLLMATRFHAHKSPDRYEGSKRAYAELRDYIAELEARAGENET